MHIRYSEINDDDFEKNENGKINNLIDNDFHYFLLTHYDANSANRYETQLISFCKENNINDWKEIVNIIYSNSKLSEKLSRNICNLIEQSENYLCDFSELELENEFDKPQNYSKFFIDSDFHRFLEVMYAPCTVKYYEGGIKKICKENQIETWNEFAESIEGLLAKSYEYRNMKTILRCAERYITNPEKCNELAEKKLELKKQRKMNKQIQIRNINNENSSQKIVSISNKIEQNKNQIPISDNQEKVNMENNQIIGNGFILHKKNKK